MRGACAGTGNDMLIHQEAPYLNDTWNAGSTRPRLKAENHIKPAELRLRIVE